MIASYITDTSEVSTSSASSSGNDFLNDNNSKTTAKTTLLSKYNYKTSNAINMILATEAKNNSTSNESLNKKVKIANNKFASSLLKIESISESLKPANTNNKLNVPAMSGEFIQLVPTAKTDNQQRIRTTDSTTTITSSTTTSSRVISTTVKDIPTTTVKITVTSTTTTTTTAAPSAFELLRRNILSLFPNIFEMNFNFLSWG